MLEIEDRIYRVETKLTAEQMVVAYTKAEKEALVLIEEFKIKAGWGNWISSSVMSMIGYGSS